MANGSRAACAHIDLVFLEQELALGHLDGDFATATAIAEADFTSAASEALPVTAESAADSERNQPDFAEAATQPASMPTATLQHLDSTVATLSNTSSDTPTGSVPAAVEKHVRFNVSSPHAAAAADPLHAEERLEEAEAAATASRREAQQLKDTVAQLQADVDELRMKLQAAVGSDRPELQQELSELRMNAACLQVVLVRSAASLILVYRSQISHNCVCAPSVHPKGVVGQSSLSKPVVHD